MATVMKNFILEACCSYKSTHDGSLQAANNDLTMNKLGQERCFEALFRMDQSASWRGRGNNAVEVSSVCLVGLGPGSPD